VAHFVLHHQGRGTPRPSPPGEGAHLIPHHQDREHPWPSFLIPRERGTSRPSPVTPRGGSIPRPSPPEEGHTSTLTTNAGEGAPLTLVLAPRRGSTPRPSPPGKGAGASLVPHPSEGVTPRPSPQLGGGTPRPSPTGEGSPLVPRPQRRGTRHTSSLTTRGEVSGHPSLVIDAYLVWRSNFHWASFPKI